ncbi:MAG TPA: GDSL-type esterase/lipase family protein [Fimbriimonas sp.]
MLNLLAALTFSISAAPSDVPGAYIQRTMRLLAESTPARRNRVRILFYGQSITVQDWWRQVEADLRRRYPSADLVVENRAIGGFAANLLGRIAPIDVAPFKPDLVILHDYGGEPDYEAMVRDIRRRTTAELLLQTDHLTEIPSPDAGEEARRGYEWHNAHTDWLKRLGNELGCGVVDVRAAWRKHLRQTGLEPQALLSDHVHLNPAGMDLMAKAVSGALVRDSRQPEGLPKDAVVVHKPVWQGKRATIEFTGNRVDVVPLEKGPSNPTKFLIDGKPPSAYLGCYTFSRATTAHKAWFPALIGVRAEEVPLWEAWTATLTNISPDGKTFDFSVKGSRTGEDGAGRSDLPFRSNSGRVLIDPKDWAVDYAMAVMGEPTPEGFEVKWSVVSMWVDESSLVTKGKMAPLTIANGLPNGKHTLEIESEKPEAIVSVVTYRPPLP